MGAYLSSPNTKLHLVEGSTSKYEFAAGSMQGWRVSNEDAHSCITNFDDNVSLFAVFDGHGGSEVAKYAAKVLPDIIKNQELYKQGDYAGALKQAFIDFDKSLFSNVDVLNDFIKSDDEESDTSANEEEVADTNGDGSTEKPQSNNICQPGTSKASSSSGDNGNQSNVTDDVDFATLRDEASIPIEEVISKYCNDVKKRILSKYLNSPIIPKKAVGESSSGGSSKDDEPGPSSSKQSETEEVDQLEALKPKPLKNKLSELITKELADESDESDPEFGEISETKPKKEAAPEKENDSETDESDEVSEEDSDVNEHDDEDDDDNDEDDNDGDDDDDDDDDEDDDDDDDDDDDEDEDDEEDDDLDLWKNGDAYKKNRPFLASLMKSSHSSMRPGYDSGCTAIVALLKDDVLYVASAGDSRCVVLKKDKFLPLSFDHKPTEEPELSRIREAGGKVVGGRINGGLNLSRALGDFSYKNEDTKPEEQMISPVPDTNQVNLSEEEFEYVVIACDGIWNSLETDPLGEFVYDKYAECNEGNPVDLVQAMFKHCLAPNTEGDGTGCDNMTCIILKLKNKQSSDLKTENPSNSNELTNNLKRKHNESLEACEETPLKHRCIDLS